MDDIRRPVFTGSWYPGDAQGCRAEIEAFLADAPEGDYRNRSWLGGIVPHAGWYFSGQIACNTIAALKDEDPIDLVVLFGMHLHPGSANYLMPRGRWGTPLGDMPVAEELAEELMGRFAFQKESPRRFNRDNTIELQMPFVKALLDPAQILALGVPPTVTSLAIGRTVADWALQKGLRTKIIGSTDLTHYGRNYDFTPHGSGAQALAWVRNENDRRVIDAMAAMDSERIINEGLDHQNACCAGAVAAAVAALQRLGADTAHQVAYATSHDRIPGESFVGYVGMLFGHID